MAIEQVSSSGMIFGGNSVNADQLTPDGMMLYLESRLGALDEKISAIIDKQKQSEASRKALQQTLNVISNCPEEGGDIDARVLADCFDGLAQSVGVEASHEIEKTMPTSIQNRVGDGNNDGNWGSGYNAKAPNPQNPPLHLSKQDRAAAKTELETLIKNIESGAELEMINLQSLMSARNTAISLSTNMASSLGKGSESITNNIGR